MPSYRPLLAAALAAAALVVPGLARADNPQLVGTVGPGFSISLQDASGNPVSHLDPGTYTLLVHDLADIHDFHLSGPGVDVSTEVEATGDFTFTITLTDGVYNYICDPHATAMHGSFTVGNAVQPTTTQTTTTQPAPAPAPAPAAPKKLAATVGPGFTISLRTPAGALVKRLKPGTYTIVVRDLSAIHNFELHGPGVSRATKVAGKGTVTWRVKLAKGTYRYFCLPHKTVMKGSFTVA